ncbi:MAG: fibronectin type III domain-containing protein, partial [Candidatus Thorarchaeota archaeon]
MRRGGWRVGTIFFLFLLILQLNNLGGIATNDIVQQDLGIVDTPENVESSGVRLLNPADEISQLQWTTGGAADWLIDTSVYKVGGSSLRSGNIDDFDVSWIETIVEGPATISFDWRVSSEINYDFLKFYIDGIEQLKISGSPSWAHISRTITTWGSHILRWTYIKDYSISRFSDCGWIDNLMIHDADYAIENPDLEWSSGGDAEWLISSSTYYTGSSSLQSGDVDNYEQSWIEATIFGPVVISFDWRTASETNYDFLRFYIDGTEQNKISGYTSWAHISHTINTWGSHTLRWAYTKDYSVSSYSDCGWIDNIQIQDVDDAVESPELVWTTGGNDDWLIDTGTYYVGGSSLRSGSIGNWQDTWIQTSVQGPLTISFDWKASSELNRDYLRFSVDGSQISSISGSTAWTHRLFVINGWGSHTLRWTYSKNWISSSYSDCGWIDNIQIQTPDTAVEDPALMWDSDGNAAWYPDTSTFSEGGSSLQSGDISNNGESWIETNVEGPGIISFDWQVSSETNYDFLRFSVDGTELYLISGVKSWARISYAINTWGSHTLRWAYTKDFSVSRYSDCGWIDNVQFNPLDDSIEIELPTVPLNFQAVADEEQVLLSWSEPVILGDQPFKGYRIYRGTSEASIAYLTTVTDTTYTDTSVSEMNDYYYQVSAINNVGEGPKTTTLGASIQDDDTTPPEIQWTYTGVKEDGDPGYIEVTASDTSGLTVDPSGTYYLTSDLGDQTFVFTATDADNDKPGDSLTTTVSVTINIHDDDTTAPEISWEYFGSYEDGDAGYIEVTASDDSGLSIDPSGTYYLSNDIGIQSFTFTATDADNDRADDTLTTTVSVDIELGDDDTTAPEIIWEYYGSYTDGDPGYILVTASDDSGLSVDPSGTYYLTPGIGTQTFDFTAVDADEDRAGDSLSTTITVSIVLEDDDTTAPEIIWEYHGSYTDGDPGYILVTASDASGLDVDPSGIYYLTTDLGEQMFEFTAVDADTDYIGDQLSTTIVVTIDITDDDTTPPEILWEYFGSYTDGDPGYIVVSASDASGLDIDPSGIYYLTTMLGEQLFEFTAVDNDKDFPGDQLSTTISVSIEIVDDDTTAPEILWEYFGSYTDGDPGYIVVSASDDSGLSDDPSGTYYLSSDIGEHTFDFTATDADNDRPDDNLSTSVSVSIYLEDDDTIAPEITWEYFGDGTDGNPGYIVVNAWDASGLSQDPSGTYYLTSDLGEQSFTFSAVDADEDRVGDQLSTSVTVTIDIIDDDTTLPLIEIEYLGGDGTDQSPGYFAWAISDSDDGIGGDADSGFSEIQIIISYTSPDGLSDYTLTLPASESGEWYLPSDLGTYSIYILARDNDDDRTLALDSLTAMMSIEQEIVDDDTEPPALTDLMISETDSLIIISFNASDYSGISDVDIQFDGKSFVPVATIIIDDSYTYKFSKDIFFELGIGSHLL